MPLIPPVSRRKSGYDASCLCRSRWVTRSPWGAILGGNVGVYLHDGGIVTNAASALVSGGEFGVLFIRNAQTVVNSGTIVGSGAGEMIAEGVLAIEMAALAKDIALTIHPHPTLSETVMESAEVFFGTSTDLYRPKRA